MDCNISVEAIINRCQELGINCIAIADHGTAQGGLKMQEMAPFTVIVAEEILTPDGEIMGMFLKEDITSGISLAEAISQIRAQGGLVCLPHPFDTVRQSALRARVTEEIVDQIDVVEVLNARYLFQHSVDKALAFAKKHGIAQVAGSDAHSLPEIGNAYVEMPEFKDSRDFLKALSKSKICGHRTNPLMHFNSVWARLQTRLHSSD